MLVNCVGIGIRVHITAAVRPTIPPDPQAVIAASHGEGPGLMVMDHAACPFAIAKTSGDQFPISTDSASAGLPCDGERGCVIKKEGA